MKKPIVHHRDQTAAIDCPFGKVQRIVTGGDGGVANVHVVRVAKGTTHVHTGYDEEAVYEVRPIGRVHNKKGEPPQLEVFEQFREGLDGLDQCSHVTVVWWFHKNDTAAKRKVLSVHPRGNKENPLTGVFATHSPMRPNLIGLTVCKVLSVKDGIVTIDGIDAFDDTPILDLKSAGSRKIKLK